MFKNLWTTPIFVKNIKDTCQNERAGIIDFFNQSKEESRFNLATFDHIATQNGYQPTLKNNNVLLEGQSWTVPLIENIIAPMTSMFWDEMSKNSSFIVEWWKVNAWLVGYDNGAFQSAHFHPTGTVSGIWYLECPDYDIDNNDGTIEFTNPMPVSTINTKYTTCFKHTPQTNDLVLFPSFLQHSAYPVRSQKKLSFVWDASIIEKPNETDLCFRHITKTN